MNILQQQHQQDSDLDINDRSIFDNHDDIITYDSNKLLMYSIYESHDIKLIGGHISNAYSIVPSIIQKIIDNGTDILMEKYLMSKINTHTIHSIDNLIDMVVSLEYIFYDNNQQIIENDEEPALVKIDNWSRAKIETKEKENVPKVDFNAQKAESATEETKKAMIKAREKAKKFLKDIKDDILPTPVDLAEIEERNSDEDQKRLKKEEEYRRKEEEAYVLKHKDEQGERGRLAFQGQEAKNKNFTFGYDGTRIPIVPPKVEKLPEPAYRPEAHIQEIRKELPPVTKKHGGTTAQKANKTKKVPLDNDRNFAPINTAPPIFDSITPAPGVSIVEGGRTKIGPKPKSNAVLTDGALTLTTTSSKDQLWITRTDYLQLTRGGNLSRQNIASNDKGRTADSQKMFNTTLEAGQKTFFEGSGDPTKNWPGKGFDGKDGNLKDKNFKKGKDGEKPGTSDGIQVSNNKIFDTLLKTVDDFSTNKFSLPPIDEKPGRQGGIGGTFIEEFKKTPIDEFNLEILNSKDWGKNIVHSSQVNALALPKHNEKVYNKTLGITRPKLPRERTIAVHIHKSKSHNVILNNLNSNENLVSSNM